MTDVDALPSKCGDCPYWEITVYPYICSQCIAEYKRWSDDAERAIPQDRHRV